MNTELIESLRTFALAHNEVAFAHLCTAALAGEQWAVERMQTVLGVVLRIIRSTDTTRPDGAIARRIEV